MERLYDRLRAYSESDYYGFHMPGHKRNDKVTDAQLPYKIDITEIEGFDDLNHPHDILREAQTRAAKVYGAEETRFLVNGSTVGILTSILAVTDRGDEILVARNCHKSVYNGIELQGLHPVYVYPSYDEEMEYSGDISADSVDNLLKTHPKIRAVVITSPTYEGIVSDVKKIAKLVHARGIPLIVDEAHGAHLGMHPYFPQNANAQGADLVIHSLHKTMPSLTQTALLHINGNLVDIREVERCLSMLQTSSPSYVLMASIDACIDEVGRKGETYFTPYVKMLKQARKELQNLKYIHLLEHGNPECYNRDRDRDRDRESSCGSVDRSKLVLSVKGTSLNGRELCEILRERYHLELEMAAGSYALAMTGPGDTEAGFTRLVKALQELDREQGEKAQTKKAQAEKVRAEKVRAEKVRAEKVRAEKMQIEMPVPRMQIVYTSAKMRRMRKAASISDNRSEAGYGKTLPWADSVGHIATEYAYLYPPGIPILVPGERISAEAAALLKMYEAQGFRVEGLEIPGRIGVWICE